MYVLPRRGFGDTTANCPSLQQLMGVADPTDPCQSPLPLTAPSVFGCVPPSVVGPLAPGQVYCQTGGGPIAPVLPASTIFPGVPNIAVYVLGGILAVFLIAGISK